MKLKSVILPLVLFVVCVAACGQDFADIGVKISGSYQGGPIDQVDLFTGNVFGSIPLVSYPQRGSLPPLTFSVNFNTAPFTQYLYCDPTYGCPGADEGTAGIVQPTVVASYEDDGMLTCNLVDNGNTCYMTLTDNTGNTHHMTQADPSAGISTGGAAGYTVTEGIWYAADGAGYALVVSNCNAYAYTCDSVLYRPDGIKEGSNSVNYASAPPDTFDTWISDPNGNQVHHSAYGATANTSIWVDSVGRTINDITHGNAAVLDPGLGTCPDSHGQTLLYVLAWEQVPSANSGTSTYYFCYGNNDRLEEVVLPDGTQWAFVYAEPAPGIVGTTEDPWYITDIYYPTGVHEQFAYTTVSRWPDWGDPSSYFAVSQRTLTLADGEVRNTYYSYDTVSGTTLPTFTTTVTDGLIPANHTMHTFTDLANRQQAYETQTDVYQGAASGTPLQTTTTSYFYQTDTTLQQYYDSTAQSYERGVVSKITNVLPHVVAVSDSLGTISSTTYNYSGLTPTATNWKIPTSVEVTGAGVSYRQTLATPLAAYNSAYGTPQYVGRGTIVGTNQLTLPGMVLVADANSNVMSATTYGYDEDGEGTVGDQTSISQWLNTGTNLSTLDVSSPSDLSSWTQVPVSSATYDAGMLATTTDGNGNTTNINAYYQCNGVYAPFPSSTTFAYGTSIAETTTATYDCNTGELTSSTDANGVVTKYVYDTMGRPTEIKSAYGISGVENHLSVTYGTNTVTVKQDQSSVDDGAISMTSQTNGLGQVTSQTAPNGASVKTTYDGNGRVASVTNPSFGLYDLAHATSYQYDALGRLTVQGQPDGNTLQRCYNDIATNSQTNCRGNVSNFSAGRWVDQADEKGNDWQQVSDGLGQLRRVIEPGLLQTEYEYNIRGNLRHIKQLGTGTTPVERSFGYDSMSHLLWSTNPESGTTCYGTLSSGGAALPYGANCPPNAGPWGGGYDGVGNPLIETNSNGNTTTYTYDALNRPTQILGWYSFPTPQVISVKNYHYDDPTLGHYGAGRLASESVAGNLPTSACNLGMWCGAGITSGAYYTYDALGRTTFKGIFSPTLGWTLQNSFGLVGYGAAYDLAGEMTQLHYPDDTVIRQTSLNGNLTTIANAAGATYMSGATYGPAGQLVSRTLGNGVTENFSYNSRFQQCEHKVQFPLNGQTQTAYDKQFFFKPDTTQETLCGDAGGNTGNIITIPDQVNSSLSRTFSYDGLNRLASAVRADNAFNYS